MNTSEQVRTTTGDHSFAWQGLLPYTLLAGLLAIAGLAYWLHWDFTIDDAAISFSYARSFSQGFGLGALYPGAARVEGYSNLLWVILLGTATWLGANTLTASKVLGLLFSAGTVAVLFLALNLIIRSKWLLAGVVLVPLSLTFSFWSASGLENSLYGFLVVTSVYFLLREEKQTTGFLHFSALALILAGMTRPDGIIYAVAGLAYKSIQTTLAWINSTPADRRSHLRRLLVWTGILLLGYLLYYAWRMWYFAYPLPNPVFAKSGWFSEDLSSLILHPQGWVYLRGYFRTFAAVSALPAMVLGALASLRGPQRVFAFFTLASLALPLFSPNWMVNYRFLYPFIPFGVALVVLAGQQLWDWITPGASNPAWLRILGTGLAIWLLIGAARFAWANIRLTEKQLACGYDLPWGEYRCLDGKNYWSMAEVDARYADLAGYARQIALDDPIFLIPDIGATSYLQNLRLLDLGGLADIHLARARDHQVREQYLFSEQLPDFIVIHSIWTRRTDLTALKSLWDHYLPVETSQDKNGVKHGTFIRRDLILSDLDQARYLQGPQADELAPGLSLLGIQAPRVYAPGVSPRLETFWNTTIVQETDLDLHLRLVSQTGQTQSQISLPLGYGWHPTTTWETGQMLRQVIQLPGDLPEGNYCLEIRVFDTQGKPVSKTAASYEFSVDQAVANTQANELTSQAEALAARGDPLSALGILQQAAVIDPGLPGLSSQIEWTKQQAQLKLLANARQQLSLAQDREGDDLSGLLEVLYQYRSLQTRQAVMPEWKSFARDLVKTGAQASRLGEPGNAYTLYLAATLADPTNAWAQRGLEATRRTYLNDMVKSS